MRDKFWYSDLVCQNIFRKSEIQGISKVYAIEQNRRGLKYMDISVWLSAGVIVSIITGIFSLIVSFNNSRKMIELEKFKKKSIFDQEKYKNLQNLLVKLLSYESILDGIPNDISKTTDIHIVATFQVAVERYDELKRLFVEWSFLFSLKNKSNIDNAIKEVDELTVYLRNPDNLESISSEDIFKMIKLIFEFNNKMIDVIKDQIEEIAN